MAAEIEVVHPGWLSLVVDAGRPGHADIGVPPSSALDSLAFATLNRLLANRPGTSALEVCGTPFSVVFSDAISFAVTGARVTAFLDDAPVEPWATFQARPGSRLMVSAVIEGFRYYVGFAGRMDLPEIIGSYSTNLECMFGGFKGRPLMRGDRITMRDAGMTAPKAVPEPLLPPMKPPHLLRILEGPEKNFFTADSLDIFCNMGKNMCYAVSAKSNRTGIRLEGDLMVFAQGAAESIVSEGILPGTVQVPPDGKPIIVLFERTMGGYARAGVVIAADLDRLAHLKPKDPVSFSVVTPEEAVRLTALRKRYVSSLEEALS